MKNLSHRINQIIPSPTLKLDAIAKQMIRDGLDVINLSVGEPDIDTPQTASRAAITAIESGYTKYTDVAAIEELRAAVAARAKQVLGLSYNSSDVVVSNGGKHSLYNIFSTLLDEADEVVIPSPYWVSYPEQVKNEYKTITIISEQQTRPLTKEILLQFLYANILAKARNP